MFFFHSPQVWRLFPELGVGYIVAAGISAAADTAAAVERLRNIAVSRLDSDQEGEWPEIAAWRRTFSRMGHKPTQYRCASEALLRRLRQGASLPSIHPLVDLCNAMSAAYGIPVAAFDTEGIDGGLEVRHARGNETYQAFGGEEERPAPGEIIFADAANFAHARRWTNRQSSRSAVRAETVNALIVVEAMHAGAACDVHNLINELAGEIAASWSIPPVLGMLTEASPRLDCVGSSRVP